MARRVICLKCHREFTAAQYRVHEFAHRRDEFLRQDPVDLPTSSLLPIEVPDDSDEVMEDTFNVPAQTVDHSFSPNDDPFSDDHDNAGGFPPYTNPFSDDHATTSTTLPPSHTSPPSPSSDEDTDSNTSAHPLEHSPVSGQPPPLIDEDLGFEDSGLDPTFTGHPSLSEQLKEHFLAGYHGGGKQY
jgi:hypothetical protein